MPLYGRKSFKIAPGLHLNVSKRGMGVSLGTRGGPKLTLEPTGRVTASQSLGHGIRFQKSTSLHGGSNKEAPRQNMPDPTTQATSDIEHDHPFGETIQREHHGFWASYGTWLLMSIGLLSYVIGKGSSTFVLGVCTGFVILFSALSIIDIARTNRMSSRKGTTYEGTK